MTLLQPGGFHSIRDSRVPICTMPSRMFTDVIFLHSHERPASLRRLRPRRAYEAALFQNSGGPVGDKVKCQSIVVALRLQQLTQPSLWFKDDSMVARSPPLPLHPLEVLSNPGGKEPLAASSHPPFAAVSSRSFEFISCYGLKSHN